LSRINSTVDEARIPSLSSRFPMLKPGASRSTRKAVIPRYPFSGSVLAKMMKISASPPFVIQS
jgi:hypothetical protein